MITIQSVDVGSCLAESADNCGRAFEVDSKVQGGHLGGNSGEQQQITNYWPSSNRILVKTNSFLGHDLEPCNGWFLSIYMFSVIDDSASHL